MCCSPRHCHACFHRQPIAPGSLDEDAHSSRSSSLELWDQVHVAQPTSRNWKQLVALLFSRKYFLTWRNLMTKFYSRKPALANTELPLHCRDNAAPVSGLSAGETRGSATPERGYWRRSSRIFVQAVAGTVPHLLFVISYSLNLQPAKHTGGTQKSVTEVSNHTLPTAWENSS